MVGMLPFLVPLLASLLGAQGTRFVCEGERAIKLRFGAAIKRKDSTYKVVYPGLRWLCPIAHKFARINITERAIDLPLRIVTLADGTAFNIGAVVKYRIKDTPQDIYNALFATVNLDQTLINSSLTVVEQILSSKTYSEMTGGSSTITKELIDDLDAQSKHWGVELLGFSFGTCEPIASSFLTAWFTGRVGLFGTPISE